jgi:outer membrane protein assembly factor BamB
MAAWMLAGAARAENWPAWRGPRGDGTSRETNVPVRWGPDRNIAWKVALPGKGHSSPVVWGERIFLTTCLEKQRERVLLALDRATGKVLWRRVVLTTGRLERKHRLNSYASSTPVTDGRRVWVTFLDYPTIHVACYDADGKELWRRSPGKFYSMHGFCSSLLPYGETVILNADQDAKGDDRAYVVAFDKATGRERWRIDRPNRVRSYCPPVVFEAAGKPQMVLSGSKCVASYDPRDGRRHWIIDGPTDQFVASMVYTDGVFLMTGGFPTLHILGIRPGGRGNVTKTHVLWHVRKDPSYVPSPIAAGACFFVVSDRGTLSCLAAKTGKYLWQERLGRHHSASPVSADGKLYFPDDDGTTFVLRAGPKFELIAKNTLPDGCRASPAVSGGQIFLRGLKHLYCIGPAAK